MSAQAFARGSALGFATIAVERGVALVTVVVLGRLLAPDAFGRYAFVVAYLNLFQVAADLGLEAVLLRRLSQSARERERLVAAALGLRLALGLAAGAAAVAFAPLAGATGADARFVVAAAAASMLFVAQPGVRALLRAELRMAQILAVAAATSLLALALVAGVARAGGGLVAVFLAAALAQAAGFVLAAAVARRDVPIRVAVVPELWRDLVRESWPIAANVLVVVAAVRVGVILLMRDRGPLEVGYFASALRLTEALNLVAEGAMLGVAPFLARLAATRPDACVALARVTAKALAVATLAAVLVVAEVSSDLLARLFRPEFGAAGTAFAILAWTAPLVALGTLYASLLVAFGRQPVLLRLNVVATGLQIALAAALIPGLGMSGVAAAAVAANVAAHAVLAALPATRALVRPCMAGALGPAACAAVVLAAARLVPLAPPARAAAMLLAFAAALVVTGTVGRRDVEALRAATRVTPPSDPSRQSGDARAPR
jgi:O-antigen/teichoic acid export membrane protein